MAKSKKRKNKKDLDFQKVKLKVGRRLKREDNETKAEFSTRKIILKEVRSYSNDPLAALARHSDHISYHGKLTMLNHFNSALSPDIVRTLNKPILDSLSKFLIDHSDQVRVAAIKCLKTCYNHTKQQHLSTKEFIYSIKPYLDCAYTHVSRDIVLDCQKFLEYFVNMNDPQTFEPLMSIILRRYVIGNLSAREKSTAIKLRRYYERSLQKQALENALKCDQVQPSKWEEDRFCLDLDQTTHGFAPDQDREVLLISVERQDSISQKYLESVIDDEECNTIETRSAKRPRFV